MLSAQEVVEDYEGTLEDTKSKLVSLLAMDGIEPAVQAEIQSIIQDVDVSLVEVGYLYECLGVERE